MFKIGKSHPGLKQQFEKGSFDIKRTKKPFSSVPIDLTFEQTINADAANKMTGLTHTTNSLSARQRWCKSHVLRSTVISYVLEQSSLRKNQNITADLNPNRIKKASVQLQNFITNLQQNINPFANNLNTNLLYNISTGKAAEEKIANF